MHRLELEVFRPNWWPEPAQGAVVLEKDRVVVADGAARAAGVSLGMRRGGVLTLVPDALIYERDTGREEAALREVAMALMRFSPEVALAEEATVVLEVSASLRLFGGILRLCRQVSLVLRAVGLSACVSAGPTGQGAWLLVQHRRRRLLKLQSLARALSVLPFDAVPELRPFSDWLSGLGCNTIADIRRLPRAGLQRRCGAGVLESLDRAFGTAPELFDWLELPPSFAARIELPDRIEHAEGILFAARRLVAQLCGWLVARHLSLSAATFLLEHERGREALAPTPLEIALGEPTWREDHLIRLLKERLARIELAASVIALRLEATNVAAAAPVSDSLFPEPGGSKEDHARLIELLAARLGEEGVLRAAPAADYRPEVANRWVPMHDVAKAVPVPAGMPRPAWLLEKPVRLLMRQHRPFYGSPLRIVSPGERIEAGWFDGGLVTRDYFVAQAQDRSCYWIYRERISSRDVDKEPSWFLHGLFG
ncbi:protein ImuB [Trinickia caryophylli]|uniref:Protein ImuB n=1 Tax=Trinickia caryophylli TaxID=28094 RepID=A0A1X7GKR6_TRICW|nr:protein ImuB [Trinickia caryophylli]